MRNGPASTKRTAGGVVVSVEVTTKQRPSRFAS
jgi:hypothetical protein